MGFRHAIRQKQNDSFRSVFRVFVLLFFLQLGVSCQSNLAFHCFSSWAFHILVPGEFILVRHFFINVKQKNSRLKFVLVFAFSSIIFVCNDEEHVLYAATDLSEALRAPFRGQVQGDLKWCAMSAICRQCFHAPQ